MIRDARWVLVVVSVLVLGWQAGPAVADTTVHARLLPTNHSGVHGTAALTTHNGDLTVVIHARGLVPGQPHAQHLHGSASGKHFRCPSKADDTDGDGLLTNEEAMGEYGDIYLSLTTRGDASADSALAVDRMPVADDQGRLDYRRTFAASDLPKGLLDHLSALHVVQHGIDVNGNGRYDMKGAGVSTFAKNLGAPGVPEEATDPSSCGMVLGAGAPVSPVGAPETGGGPAVGLDRSSVLVGGSLVAVSLTFLALRVRGRRGRGERA